MTSYDEAGAAAASRDGLPDGRDTYVVNSPFGGGDRFSDGEGYLVWAARPVGFPSRAGNRKWACGVWMPDSAIITGSTLVGPDLVTSSAHASILHGALA